MKKSKILLTIALAGLLVACGTNNEGSNSVPGSISESSVSVKGSDSTGPESIVGDSTSTENKPSASVGSDSETKPSESVGSNSSAQESTSSVVDPDPIPTTFTFYLSPVEGVSWDEYYVYTWNSETDTPKVAWPGEIMSYDTEKGYYAYEIEKDSYNKVIFGNGLDTTEQNGHQTKDLEFDYEHPVFFLTSVNGTGQWGNIGDHFDPVVDPIPGGDTFTFYLSPVEGVSWTSYFVYTWNSETDTPKVSWPGEMMGFDPETGYYTYEIEKDYYNKLIFSNGLDSTEPGAHQTKDLEFDYEHPVFFLTSLKGGQWGNIGDHFDPVVDPIPGGDTFTFYLSTIEGVSWNAYYVYTWNSETNTPKVAWPGELMPYDTEKGCYTYEIEKDSYNKVIFSNGMNSTDAGAHQTKDLDFNYEHPVFFLTSTNGAGQWGDFGDNFDPTETFQWFVIGEMTGWTVNDSYGMNSKGNNIFAYTGSFNANVPFKIVSDSNDWYGGEKLDAASNAYVSIDTSDNNNMKFNAAGTYTITWDANSNTISITAA